MDTFIVRLWRPGATSPMALLPPQLAGEVIHVTSGASARFGTAEQFLAFLSAPDGLVRSTQPADAIDEIASER